jgi:hypothetical protein
MVNQLNFKALCLLYLMQKNLKAIKKKEKTK